jgi:hypothetical protein
MPYATNALDGSRVYFEDDGGDGSPIVLHGGIIDAVDLVRESNIARALQELTTTPQPSRQLGAQQLLRGRSQKTLGRGNRDASST